MPRAARSFIAARFDPKAALGLHLTIGLVVGLLGIWAFGALLEEVLDNATMVRWDVAADNWVHARATPGGVRLFGVVTQLGAPVLMSVVAVVGAVVLLRLRHRTTLIAWLAAFVGGALVDQALKAAVRRNRPAFEDGLHLHSYSFPSGHSMGSMIGYGMLIYVLSIYWRPGKARLRLASTVAALIVLGVGVSRIYLGVHYPSDVAGGFAAGGAWLAVCITAHSVASRRALWARMHE